jgi:hypothetical protein
MPHTSREKEAGDVGICEMHSPGKAFRASMNCAHGRCMLTGEFKEGEVGLLPEHRKSRKTFGRKKERVPD